jgi:antitoxin component YwqK of YwqJK toxin-antitoxin module
MKYLIFLIFISTSGKAQETINQLHSWDPWYEKFYGEEKVESLGKNISYHYKVGITEHYYDVKKTRLKSRTKDSKRSTYYIDFFDKNNVQICSNGNGFAYTIENGTNDFPHRDSLVYQITDGKRTGKFLRYRKYLNSQYCLIVKGNLIDQKEYGYWETIDTISEYKKKANYRNGKLHGYYYQYSRKNNIDEEGEYKNGKKVEKWKVKDTNSTYIVAEFKDNNFFGSYIRFWKNDSIKEKGNYIQITGDKEVLSTDIESGKTIKKIIKVENLSVKNGEWIYFNEIGEKIKVENYKNGVLQ